MLKTLIIGNLGRDCTTNEVNGRSVINFNVAHTEKWRDAGGQENEKTTWVDCAYWTDKTAIAQYLLKGTQVYCEGIPDVHVFTASDGTTKATIKLKVGMVQLLGSKREAGSNGAEHAPASSQQAAPKQRQAAAPAAAFNPPTRPADDDDLPF